MAEIREARVLEQEERRAGDAAEHFPVGAVGPRGVQGLEDLRHRAILHAEGAGAGGVAEGLGHGRLAGGRAADQDDVAVLLDEAAREEFLDDLRGELGPRGPVEALEGDGRAELAPAAPALQSPATTSSSRRRRASASCMRSAARTCGRR
jgi:hypothetical protein